MRNACPAITFIEDTEVTYSQAIQFPVGQSSCGTLWFCILKGQG